MLNTVALNTFILNDTGFDYDFDVLLTDTYDFDVLLGMPWTAPALITAPLVMAAAGARESASLAGTHYTMTARGPRWSATIANN